MTDEQMLPICITSICIVCQQLQESLRTSSQGWIFYKTSTVCVFLEAEPVPLVRPHPVRYAVR